MKRYIVLVYMLVLALTIQSQDVNDYSHYFLSPNAASLQKFGDYPVSHHNGLVNISISLYSIKLNEDVTLNVQLDYHASGIKVDEITSWIGAGWALSAGGVINREQRGYRDEAGSGFYSYSIKNKGHVFPEAPLMPHSSDNDYAFLNKITNAGFDTEPDIFTFNFNGQTGKFFVDNTGEFRMLPHSNIKIVKHPLGNRLATGSWELVDESGTRYVFGDSPTAGIDIIKYYGWEVPVSWYLSSIYSSSGELLASFSYNTSREVSYTTTSYTTILKLKHTDCLYTKEPTIEYTGGKTVDLTGCSNLTAIDIPKQGRITFSGGMNRRDGVSTTAQLLGTIELSDKSNNKVSSYSFEYSFYNKHFLDKIKYSGKDNSSIDYRQFEYYDKGTFPPRGSNAVDIWGYYNGIMTNTTKFPRYSSYDLSIAYKAADRRPTEKAMTGTLKKIIYPTKGYTVFSHENNIAKARENADYLIGEKKLSSSNALDSYGTTTKSFIIDRKQWVAFNYKYAFHEVGLYTSKIEVRKDGKPVVTWDGNGNDFIRCQNEGNCTASKDSYSNMIMTGVYELELEPGTYNYTITVSGLKPVNFMVGTSLTVNYTGLERIGSSLEQWLGGLRIAKIENYDADGKRLSEEKFSYADSNGNSSGVDAPGPYFKIDRTYIKCMDPLFGVDVVASPMYSCYNVYEGISEQSVRNVTYPVVQYENIIVDKMEDSKPVLRSEYKYKVKQYTEYLFGIAHSVLGYLEAYRQSEDNYQYGFLVSRKDYEKRDNSFISVREEYNDYTPLPIKKITAYHVEKKYVEYDSQCRNLNDQRVDFKYSAYKLVSGASYLAKKSIKTTDKTGNSITVVQNYSYNNSFYLQPSDIVQTDSRNNEVKQEMKYPYDKSDAVYIKMKELNIINKPVEKINKVNNINAETNRYNYSFFNDNKNIEIASIENKYNGNDFIAENTFTRYDKSGNILEHITKDGVITILVWSYSGQYPIAEIKNATFTEVEVAAKTVFSVANTDALSAQLTPNEAKLKDGSLQRALANALVTTYTYKPLVGMLTATGPSGVTTYYEYDAFGRLEETYIKDASGNKQTVQKYDYHYQNQ
ncbi:hypothetical protein [Dysgonomonas termitidis]|uniref:RHS repeat protein n=1 Tax=Dysgonomonas termitidis TaxID=1516126 RepID=A0ABV9L3V3_9BACT